MNQLTTTHHPPTILLAGEKGGIGKTNTAVNLAHAFALQNLSALLIDADPNASVSASLGLPSIDSLYQYMINNVPVGQLITATHIPGLTVLRGNQTTRRTANTIRDESASGGFPPGYIATKLRSAANLSSAAVVIVDTPPNGGFWPEQLYLAADLILLPVTMDNIDLTNTLALQQKLQIMDCQADVLLLPNIYVEHETNDRDAMAELRAAFPAAHILPPIPRSATIKKARREGITLIEKAPNSEPAKVIRQIAATLINHLHLTRP